MLSAYLVQDVLFESKLANMCLKPKVIDSSYLKRDERELLNHWAPEFAMSNAPVLTHMYDTVRTTPPPSRGACFSSTHTHQYDSLCGV
jgi:hypothetical protein